MPPRKSNPKTPRQSPKGKEPTIEVSYIAKLIDSDMKVTP